MPQGKHQEVDRRDSEDARGQAEGDDSAGRMHVCVCVLSCDRSDHFWHVCRKSCNLAVCFTRVLDTTRRPILHISIQKIDRVRLSVGRAAQSSDRWDAFMNTMQSTEYDVWVR